MLPQQKRNLIDAAIAAGRQATRSRTGQITLALGAADRVHYIKLADEFGLTEAGEYYYEQTQEVRPIRGVDLAQIPYKRGDSEYIRDHQDKERAVRVLSNGEWRYTPLGRRFFNNQGTRAEAVVYVPVVVAMAASLDVCGAFSRGMVAILAGLGATAVGFAAVPLLCRAVSAPVAALAADRGDDRR
jgi:hypothetical protein